MMCTNCREATTVQILDGSDDDVSINPFEHKMKLTLGQKIQIAFMTVTVFPLRLFMVLLTLFLSWLSSLLLTIGMSDDIPSQPVGPIRRNLINGWLKLFRSMFFFLGFHHVQVEGKRASREEAPILIVGPHTSMFDLIFACVTSPLPSMLAAMKTRHVPFFGRLSRICQPIFVSRLDRNSLQSTANEIQRRAQDLKPWPQIAIFPEGTTSNGKALITFKSGAFKPGVPVQPVVIEFLNDLDTFSWTVTSPLIYIMLWFSMCQFSLKFKVTYLPVYNPSEEEKRNPFLYASNVRKIMSEKSKLPCTGHSYEDFRLAYKALSLSLPMKSGLVEYSKLNQELGLKYDDISKRLEEFAIIATDRKNGLTSLREFAKYCDVPFTPILRETFGLLPHDSNDLINFLQFLKGVSFTSNDK